MKFHRIKTLTMRDKLWHVLWRCPPGPKKKAGKGKSFVGHCSPSDKRIYINPDKDRIEFLGNIIHESTHAAFPDLDDPSVEEFESGLMRLLRRMKIKVSFDE